MADTTSRFSHASIWLLRLATFASGSTVVLLDDRLDELAKDAALLGTIALWATWALILLCVLVPSSVALTGIRLLAPVHLAITSIVTIGDLGDRPSTLTIVALVPTFLTVLSAFSAEVGTEFVQSSAYGDETRIPLLPPIPFLTVLVTSWVLWVASGIVGSLALTREAWVAGGILVAVTVALTAILPPRFHRFSRRWIVIVPAGLVVHDHVVLAETAMFTRTTIRSVTSTRRDDDAADLSGRRGGTGVEVQLTDFETVVLAATPSTPGGSALHVKTFWVRPSRPGRLINAWSRRRSSAS